MEDVLPPQTRGGAGFEPARVRQFTVFLENRVGRLQMLVRALEQGGIRIAALSVEEASDCALARLICSDPDATREVLEANTHAFGESELLAVELPRKTHQPLIAICSALLAAEINIHSAYPFLTRPRGGPALALYVDDAVVAAQLLIRKGFTLIGESDLR